MICFAIDPGTAQSAFVALDTRDSSKGKIIDARIVLNADMVLHIKLLSAWEHPVCVACEVPVYGKNVGRELFETCIWIGEFRAAAKEQSNIVWTEYARASIKAALLGTARGNDADVRRLLKIRYDSTKKGGTLYGITSHMWAALAVATYCADGAKLGAW